MTQVEFEKLVYDFSCAKFATEQCLSREVLKAMKRKYTEARQALIDAFNSQSKEEEK